MATQTSLSSGQLRRFLLVGSYYHYVIAIFANTAVHFLLGQRGLLEVIRRAPGQFPTVFEELVRLTYPLLIVERWTRVTVELGGCVIPARNLVYLAIGAANRDPAAFERPDEFVVSRARETAKKPLTGYANVSAACAHWEELGHLACRTFLKALLTKFPILEPVNPLGESEFTITHSQGDLREVLQIPFLRYLSQFEVKFQRT